MIAPTTSRVSLPAARGPFSGWVLDRLRDRPTGARPTPGGAGMGGDVQLALYLTYEAHFSDLPDVVADREWDPELIALRHDLEDTFVDWLRDVTAPPPDLDPDDLATSVRQVITRLIDDDDGPSVSSFMERDGTLDQMREFVVHRSAYQLKEGDAHTFAIPRIDGRAKQLLVEIQAGEYGADDPGRETHAGLFAATMRELGLDDRRHAHLDRLPPGALAVSNLISLFGLNRRWRGALVGHLTAFEMTSVVPMGRYARALCRLRAPAAARRFYEVHVLADAEHELAALEMAGLVARDHPELARDVVFGAQSALAVERVFAAELFESWTRPLAMTPG